MLRTLVNWYRTLVGNTSRETAATVGEGEAAYAEAVHVGRVGAFGRERDAQSAVGYGQRFAELQGRLGG